MITLITGTYNTNSGVVSDRHTVHSYSHSINHMFTICEQVIITNVLLKCNHGKMKCERTYYCKSHYFHMLEIFAHTIKSQNKIPMKIQFAHMFTICEQVIMTNHGKVTCARDSILIMIPTIVNQVIFARMKFSRIG